MIDSATEPEHDRFLKGKSFSCKNECKTANHGVGGQCCKYSVIRCLKPKTEIIDVDFWSVHDIEVVERDISEELMTALIGNDDSITFRMAKKQLKKILEAGLKEVVFKINIPCTQLRDDGLCRIYESRPHLCKVSGIGGKDFPFENIKGCPYMKND